MLYTTFNFSYDAFFCQYVYHPHLLFHSLSVQHLVLIIKKTMSCHEGKNPIAGSTVYMFSIHREFSYWLLCAFCVPFNQILLDCTECNSLHLCWCGIVSAVRPICIHLLGIGKTRRWQFSKTISAGETFYVSFSVISFSFKLKHKKDTQQIVLVCVSNLLHWDIVFVRRSDFLKDLQQKDDLLQCYATYVPLLHSYLAII